MMTISRKDSRAAQIMELFTQTLDYCSGVYDRVPQSQQNIFFRATEDDPELKRLMTLAESADELEQIRQYLHAYMERFKRISRDFL